MTRIKMRCLRPFTSLIAFLMALWVINFSVDPPDGAGHEIVVSGHFEEDPSYNEMESVVEVLVEKVMGYDRAVPESDEQDGPTELCKVVKVYYQPIEPLVLPDVSPHSWNADLSLELSTALQERHYLCDREVNSPPPWV